MSKMFDLNTSFSSLRAEIYDPETMTNLKNLTYNTKLKGLVRNEPRKSYWRGMLSTVDLLVLTSLDQSLFILKILFTFITKQATIMRSTVLSLPLSIPWMNTRAYLS
jgi:hypothetical protein